jgi:hypothetical protein
MAGFYTEVASILGRASNPVQVAPTQVPLRSVNPQDVRQCLHETVP